MDSERADEPDDRASPEPWQHEPGTISIRPVAIGAALLALAAIVFLGYTCFRNAGPGSTFMDQTGRYAPGSVTYLASGRTYLIRKPDGSFLALSEVEATDADRVTGCVIRFRPDLKPGAEAGVFRDDCHGTLFDRDGRAVQGAAPPMQRHPVTVTGNDLTVRFKACMSGEERAQGESCRE